MKGKITKRNWLSIVLLVIVIPAVLYLCRQLGNRYYYIASLVIMLITATPFILSFERRRPQARELVVIAVMSALAVASRAAFIWIPNFKPICAIVMIAGIALGAESGFVVGAVSAFVSNFIFGQGPWTPWQMFAYGMAGFLAGLAYRLHIIDRNRFKLCAFGFLCILCIIGPILDLCAIFTMASTINVESWGAIFLSGLPVNVIHGIAVALTMLLFANPLLDKLDRVRVKYGMLEEENAL